MAKLKNTIILLIISILPSNAQEGSSSKLCRNEEALIDSPGVSGRILGFPIGKKKDNQPCVFNNGECNNQQEILAVFEVNYVPASNFSVTNISDPMAEFTGLFINSDTFRYDGKYYNSPQELFESLSEYSPSEIYQKALSLRTGHDFGFYSVNSNDQSGYTHHRVDYKVIDNTIEMYLLMNWVSKQANEKDAQAGITSYIKSKTSDPFEQMQALSLISKTFETFYNDNRNPLGKNNSDGGTLGLNDMAKSVVEKNSNIGGVCNDIAGAIGGVAKNLFPDKKVFTLQAAGSGFSQHFVLAILDERDSSYQIIDYSQVYEKSKSGGLQVNEVDPGVTIRMQEIETTNDGVTLKDVGNFSTNYGQFLSSLHSTPALPATTIAPNNFLFNVLIPQKLKTKSSMARDNGIAMSSLPNDSYAIVIYGNRKAGKKDSENRIIGVDIGAHISDGGLDDISLHGININYRTLIDLKYKAKDVNIELKSRAGHRVEAQLGFSFFDGNFGFINSNQLAIDYKSKFFINANYYSNFQLGNADYSQTMDGPKNLKRLVANLIFFKNQLKLEVEAGAKLNSKVDLKSTFSNESSALGQRLSGSLELSYTSQKDVKLYISHSLIEDRTIMAQGFPNQNTTMIGCEIPGKKYKSNIALTYGSESGFVGLKCGIAIPSKRKK